MREATRWLRVTSTHCVTSVTVPRKLLDISTVPPDFAIFDRHEREEAKMAKTKKAGKPVAAAKPAAVVKATPTKKAAKVTSGKSGCFELG